MKKLLPALLGTVVVGAVFANAANAGLGKAPQICSKTSGSPCLVKGGGGETLVSPHIVRVGEKFTVTLESSDGEYAGVGSWTDPGVMGATRLGCTGKKVHKPGDQWTADMGLGGARKCTFKATGSSHGWQIVRINFNVRYGGLASYDDDTLAIVPKGQYYISGEVRSKPYPGSLKEGTPIRGMTVGVFSDAKKAGGGYAFSKKVKTNNNGFWEVQVAKKGGYDVLPYLRDGDRKIKPQASLEPGRKQVRVTDSDDPEANFRLDRALGISAEIRNSSGHKIESAPADGLTAGRLVVEIVSPNDDPQPNMTVDLKVNTANGSGGPHAKICSDDGGTRYWPAPTSWAPSIVPTGLKTDAKGQVAADVFFGTDPGTLRISASVPGQPRLYDAAEVHMKPDAPLGLSSGSLAKALMGAIASRASNGYSLNGKALGMLTTSLGGPDTAARTIAEYLSTARDSMGGVEFSPIQAAGNGGTVYGVAFYPSGQVVQTKSGVLTLPASALILPPTNLGALISLGKRVGQIVADYTANAIPTVGAWRAQTGAGPIRVESSGIPFGLYGGGPYAGGAILKSGCRGN